MRGTFARPMPVPRTRRGWQALKTPKSFRHIADRTPRRFANEDLRLGLWNRWHRCAAGGWRYYSTGDPVKQPSAAPVPSHRLFHGAKPCAGSAADFDLGLGAGLVNSRIGIRLTSAIRSKARSPAPPAAVDFSCISPLSSPLKIVQGLPDQLVEINLCHHACRAPDAREIQQVIQSKLHRFPTGNRGQMARFFLNDGPPAGGAGVCQSRRQAAACSTARPVK